MKTSEARRSIRKYQQKFATIRASVLPPVKEKVQQHAVSTGESVNAFIIRAIQETMARDKAKAQAEASHVLHNYKGKLYNADPTCEHNVIAQLSGGVKCTKCGGWFAY